MSDAKKYVYIWKKEGRCDSSDYTFHESAELLWEVYDRMDGFKSLTKAEFIEAIEDFELVDEFGSEWYKDTVVTG
jgi:hypothetical protein